MGVTPSGAVFERAYRVEAFSIKCEHLLSCFFSPFGDWWKFSSVSSFKYCTYSHLKEYQFGQKVQHKYADMVGPFYANLNNTASNSNSNNGAALSYP